MSSKGPWFAQENRTRYLVLATACVVVIGIADWFIIPNVELGYLYFVPIILVSAFLSRLQIASFVLVCAAMRDLFLPAAPEKWVRLILVYGAFLGVGLVVRNMVFYRRVARDHLSDLQRQIRVCVEVEDRLQQLINSIPFGMVMLSSEFIIVYSNLAAHKLLGIAPGALLGQCINLYLPELQRSLPVGGSLHQLETVAQKTDGQTFPVHVWVYPCNAPTGQVITAIILDASQRAQPSASGFATLSPIEPLR